MFPDKNERLHAIAARVMRIDDITYGESKQQFLVRYRGEIFGDTAEAYDKLVELLRPLEITPLFRKDQDRHAVIFMPGLVRPAPSRVWVNALLFALTVISVIFTGALFSYQGPVPENNTELVRSILSNLGSGLSFAASLLAILVAHEFGHYLAGRYHKVAVTLPYFLPFPLSPFGTAGAFIQLKESPKNRRVLLDIGIAGPLAGLVVAVPVLLLGLKLSALSTIQLAPGQGLQMEGNSLLYLLAKLAVFGRMLPAPASFEGLPPLLYWVRYFFTGQPFPMGGLDVMLHPVAYAGWAGLLVTALNLIPAGQLDGGHLLYVLAGKRAIVLLPVILGGLVLLGWFWPGWWLWAFVIFLLGRFHAEPLDQITPLDPPRRVLALIGLIVFILVFTPVPLLTIAG